MDDAYLVVLFYYQIYLHCGCSSFMFSLLFGGHVLIVLGTLPFILTDDEITGGYFDVTGFSDGMVYPTFKEIIEQYISEGIQ